MNTKCRFSLFFSVIFCTAIFGQGTWIQKVDFAGTARYEAVGFSIGTKGYIGTGWDGTGSPFKKDFWEWDQAANVWAQKANFAGTARDLATGFSIGTKGYIGTGWDGSGAVRQDFWEWDQATNLWAQKTNFGGGGKLGAVGFSIGNYGYIGTGATNFSGPVFNYFWEWDQAANVWAQKANFAGAARAYAAGFSIGTKGYIGTGSSSSGLRKDFWEWDQATNVWTQIADFGGTARATAVGFSIGTKGFLCAGWGGSGNGVYYNDLWEWDQATNLWAQKANFGGTGRGAAVGFSIGTKGYIGTGSDGAAYKRHFWEYNPSAVGIDEVSNSSGISVFPNPAHNYITIDCTLKENTEVCAELYDLNGKKVSTLLNTTQQIGEHRELINLSAMNLQSGVYSVILKVGDKISSQKLIIN